MGRGSMMGLDRRSTFKRQRSKGEQKETRSECCQPEKTREWNKDKRDTVPPSPDPREGVHGCAPERDLLSGNKKGEVY